ncbi:ExbD/TolR family protein [Ruixingdingia sedimenti]|uniref:Biopolymer transporter ExbD n=1 Tax=Ruixingdingia sedimenti TaxID=3073604 RepID=A0ABU1F2G7_9RHOB|nr:biopolymer transporter ExbD [Xinfangfangia sp. LG-4]MDR5651056.1 biopolymer transporter ExbD [Xinfangfangia sp. LG-4]
MMSFGEARRRRRLNLIPMIDVVFILLVFFMMSSRLTAERTLPLSFGGTGGSYSGPPRLVELTGAGVTLNGRPVPRDMLAAELSPLMEKADDAVILRPREGADVQALFAVMDTLTAAGMSRLILME